MKMAVGNEKGSVLLAILVAFTLLLFSLFPIINNLIIWKENLQKMEQEANTDYLLESGIALALHDIQQEPDFLGNRTYVYNGNTYVIQFTPEVSSDPLTVNLNIQIPALTQKELKVDVNTDTYTIQYWEESF
ncbi:hypothetical protein [Tepidibacillus sp. HK-1]|uniref:hypothetical protein n=1 Tax=Tepidibacillus sp. HK-1 TaxID=1883407 RepID=UPI0008531D29|nr:hypothetical protein [Tepidibacillus sp. HK-1]GBF10993.1 hypothetical protein HK1_01011 [Tepidibacillus sp. HK-1]